MKPDQWTSVINTNVLSAYGILHPIINQMRDREAAETKNIVFVSSVNAHRPVMGQTNYAASKAALLALNRCLAIENASKNIRCNVVSPGYIETEMTAKMRDDVKKRIESDIPLKRFGSVDEIASIVTMLVTEPHYFQGANIDVNGGLFIR
jgi:acetoacetyl-CoA reductase